MTAKKRKRVGKPNNSCEEITIDSWTKFRRIFEQNTYRSWAFRGQSNASWSLFSSLSRYLIDQKVHQAAWVIQEERILRIFRRKAHLFLKHIPNRRDSFEWLALMQHHGAPTRLLDFTWSPYVAAFFALERATSDAAVWAIYPPGLYNGKIKAILESQGNKQDDIGPWVKGNYERYFLPNVNPVVVIGEPQNMNQRLIAQSGTFVMPGILDKPIEELVIEQTGDPHAIVKFVLITSQIRRKAMKELYLMNLTNATLFPGLDGLARSMALEFEFHWAFDPITNKKFPGYWIE